MLQMISLLKKRFIKSTLIYYIYRYFKYKLKYFPSYGASGEDVLIGRYFKNKTNGFYVDVGALHPINGSMTYNLSKMGWKGINLDMMQENLMLFNLFRKKDINVCTAISSSKGEIEAYLFESGSGLNTNSIEWANKWKKKLDKDFVVRKVKKEKLNNILKRFNVNKAFELLNIDVEGHELEVLKGMNFKLYRPKLITIEIHVDKTKDIFKSNVYKFLSKYKYELISQYRQTSFFIPVENLRTLD